VECKLKRGKGQQKGLISTIHIGWGPGNLFQGEETYWFHIVGAWGNEENSGNTGKIKRDTWGRVYVGTAQYLGRQMAGPEAAGRKTKILDSRRMFER